MKSIRNNKELIALFVAEAYKITQDQFKDAEFYEQDKEEKRMDEHFYDMMKCYERSVNKLISKG